MSDKDMQGLYDLLIYDTLALELLNGAVEWLCDQWMLLLLACMALLTLSLLLHLRTTGMNTNTPTHIVL